MDIVTQGLLGAAMALAVSDRQEARVAAGIGFAAALLVDADILIRSANDPLLNIEFHRHFSHSLIFIPIGGLLAALILWPFLRKHLSFKKLYFYSLAGYATAGLLDACTSYGTHLLWPFSDERIAWRIIAIVDPVFSITLIIALIIGLKVRKPKFAKIGLCVAAGYLMLGVLQHHRALNVATHLAQQRGHTAERQMVKPTMANLVLWRSVYESDGIFYVDAIRVGPLGSERIYAGSQAVRFQPARDIPGLNPDSALQQDINRFLTFSDHYVILDPERDKVLVDLRYSMLPTGLSPLWGINMNVGSDSEHAQFINFRDSSDNTRQRFVDMLLGR